MIDPEIIYTQEPSGKRPVQAEGTIAGRKFYFRSRGKSWCLSIAEPGGDPLKYSGWYHREQYPGVDYEEPTEMYGHIFYFSAGWAKPEECKAFIQKAARLWLRAHSDAPPPQPPAIHGSP